ncbi:hypothetical protein FO519_008060, partial [Halicephalobus sp. NKZ332]
VLPEVQTCGAPALRVVQLDSHILDNEIQTFLDKQLNELVSELPVSFTIFWEKYREEAGLILSGILWSYRFLKGYSPGQQMMDVAYRTYPRRVIVLHFVLVVFLPYFSKKIIDRIRDQRKKEQLQKIINFGKFLEFLHHLNFLRTGGYSSIWERVLRLKTEYTSPPTLGLMSFTTLNRELLWHSYRDVLLLILPLAQTTRQLWTRWRTRRASRLSKSTKMKLDMKPFSPLICNRCESPAIVPVRNEDADILKECGHVFCLYCYDPNFECPKCGFWLSKGKETLVRGIVNPFR